MHAAHNLFIQAIFNQLTSDTGITENMIDEFGVGLALITRLCLSLLAQAAGSRWEGCTGRVTERAGICSGEIDPGRSDLVSTGY
jgi:hypothetical protein